MGQSAYQKSGLVKQHGAPENEARGEKEGVCGGG